MGKTKHQYLTLDGMRGLAALMVATLHISGTLKLPLFQHAYLAVDFFFILSGFVIGAAYDNRLKSSMSLGVFALIRVIRLWPLFVLGLALMVAAQALRALTVPDAIPLGSIAAAGAFEMFMLPAPPGLAWVGSVSPLYPLNMPSWSLFFELVANFAYGFAARFLTLKRLIVVVSIAAFGLALSAMWLGSLEPGGRWVDGPAGLIRVGFGFFLGLLIQRLHNAPSRQSTPGSLALCALLGTVLAVGSRGVLGDLAAAFVAFPLLVMAGARLEPGAWLKAPMAWLGRASYAIYILHLPMALLTLAMLHKLGGERLPAGVTLAVLLGVVLTAATIADRFWDGPVREVLSKLSRPAPIGGLTHSTSHPI